MQDSLMSQGLSLMFTGMGTVIIFLAMLVVLTNLATRLIARYFPDPIAKIDPTPKPALVTQAVDAHTLKVIQKAVSEHRAKRH